MHPLPRPRLIAGLALLIWLPALLMAHPVPDIPVRGDIQTAGPNTIRVQVDTRVFSEDPENEPYLLNWVLKEMSDWEREQLLDQTRELLPQVMRLVFTPEGSVGEPDFQYEFTTLNHRPLEGDEDPVMISATWTLNLEKAETYQLQALPEGRLALQFLNHIDGQEQRLAVLFPGEDSYVLPLEGGMPVPAAASEPAAPEAGIPTEAGSGEISATTTGSWSSAIIAFLVILALLGVWLVLRRRMVTQQVP